MDWLIERVGRKFGHPAKVWTDWYHHCWEVGVLILAYMREQLNAHNLISTYPHGELVGFQKPGQRPPLGVTHFRAADGSWNNLADPKEGAAKTRFLRNVDLSVTCPDPRLLTPNPREISRKLLTRPIQRWPTRRDDSAIPQSAGRIVDPVHEPRLDQPRRHRP